MKKWQKISLVLALSLSTLAFGGCEKDKVKEEANTQTIEEKADESVEKAEKDKEKEKNTESTEKTEENKVEVGPFAGNTAIDFELESFTEDKTYKLSDYLGKDPIIINFFASWCGPCKKETPELNEIYKEYKDKGLKVLAVNLGNGDSEEDVKKLIEDYIVEYPVLKDPKSSIAREYLVQGIPVNIFITKDGKIYENMTGALDKESYKKRVEKLLEIEE